MQTTEIYHHMNSCNCPTPTAPALEATQSVQRPRVHTHEDESGARLQVALPGVRKEDLKLTLHESNLTIKADRSDAVPENWKTHGGSNNPERYELNVRLTFKLDGSKTTASFDGGVLTLQVPLREEAKPRQIQVN
ncbi:MAG: Hsp20/alpha crystallin family protein [Luteolibacter sp.]